MKIYSEWTIEGKIQRGEFNSLAEYYAALNNAQLVRAYIISVALPGELHKSRSLRRQKRIRRTTQN
jgi:hypothetical protein